MYDKTVRRRRALLVLLVVLSLILLTAYFGEAPGGRLHGVQRAFLTVVSPIQNGANKALKPVRDTIGWFGDTINAKGQRDSLRRQNAALRRKLVADQAEKRSLLELKSIYHVDQLRADDHAIGEAADLPGLLRGRNAEADRQGQRSGRARTGHEALKVC